MGLGLVLAYRLSVEIYDRREYSRFEKERQQLNWKQVRPAFKLPPCKSLPQHEQAFWIWSHGAVMGTA